MRSTSYPLACSAGCGVTPIATGSCLLAGLGARHHHLPLVVTPHYHGRGHTPFRNLLHLPYRPIGGWAMRQASQILANSLAEERWLRRDFGDLPITLNPNGVDLPTGDPGSLRLPERGADERVLLTVGRLEGYKRVDRVVGALRALPDPYTLTILGDGPARNSLQTLVAQSGLAQRVRLPGYVSSDELRGWYAVADAYLALSEDESFGMTVLEAAAAGAPVVASDIPAHREVVGYLPQERVHLVDATADDAELAAVIEATVALGRSSDRSGWRLPTWSEMVDGVVAAYGRALDDAGSVV
jgi:1,2-diacylglycerol 3-alpha-glucosyltransferase